jgi:hypothetical protein
MDKTLREKLGFRITVAGGLVILACFSSMLTGAINGTLAERDLKLVQANDPNAVVMKKSCGDRIYKSKKVEQYSLYGFISGAAIAGAGMFIYNKD